MEESLNSLEIKATDVESQYLPSIAYPGDKEKEPTKTDIAEKNFDLAAKSPKAALMFLASEIEKELRVIVAITGHHTHIKGNSPRLIAAYLGRVGWLTESMVETVQAFNEIRNKMVHGYDVNPDHILRAVDSGLSIFKALDAIPHEINTVYHPGVDLFYDKECEHKVGGVRGIILETTSPGRSVKSKRIYPTKLTTYQKDKQVSWEWNMENTWGKTWYRDPDTNEIKSAWGSSAEFVGRHIDEL